MHLVNENDPYILDPKTFERKYEQVVDTIRQAANTSAVSISKMQPPMDDKNTKNNLSTNFKVFYRFDPLHFSQKYFYPIKIYSKLRSVKLMLSPIQATTKNNRDKQISYLQGNSVPPSKPAFLGNSENNTMNENEVPAIALPLTDLEVENHNQGIEQENHQDLPSSNPGLQNDNTVQVTNDNVALNDQSDVATNTIGGIFTFNILLSSGV